MYFIKFLIKVHFDSYNVSVHPPRDLSICLPNPTRAIHEHIFLETTIYEFRGGKPPTWERQCRYSPSEIALAHPGGQLPSKKFIPTGRLPSRMFTPTGQLLWATTIREAHPWMGNDYSRSSSSIRQLPPLRLIPNQATTICVTLYFPKYMKTESRWESAIHVYTLSLK